MGGIDGKVVFQVVPCEGGGALRQQRLQPPKAFRVTPIRRGRGNSGGITKWQHKQGYDLLKFPPSGVFGFF